MYDAPNVDNLSAKLLLVDDEPFFLSVVRNNLRQCGFKNIFSSAGGKEALNLLRTQEIDLLISDINMRPMSGLELVHRIRTGEIPVYVDLPIIFLTGQSDLEMVKAAASLKIDGFIRKPVTINQLKTTTTKVLAANSGSHHRSISGDSHDLVKSAETRFEKSVPLVKPSVQKLKLKRSSLRADKTGRSVEINKLRPGMRLHEDIASSDGTLLLQKGEPLHQEQIDSLRAWSGSLKTKAVKVRAE